MSYMQELGRRARAAATALASTGTRARNEALLAIAKALEARLEDILAENGADIENAQKSGMSAAMVDRLRLTADRVADMAGALRYVAGLDDPVGRVLDGGVRPNGLSITRITVPLGVVGIIFESRPNVTVDCAALCLKSGNACILRGGKEAIRSNKILADLMRGALKSTDILPDAILLVEDTSREIAAEMMRLSGAIDVLIPRGGPGLIASVVQNASVPVIETGVGNCHAYVDADADLNMALEIVDNGKTSRPSVCNALETLLVHRQVAGEFLPRLWDRLKGVALRGCPETVSLLGGAASPACPEDWDTEYGDYILAIKVVGSIDEAIAHIAAHSTHHSEVIVTNSCQSSRRFTLEVDSAAVYVNASTRFTDGGEFGLGAEIGISTQKLHARGPMGLRELVSYKYIITGSGQIR